MKSKIIFLDIDGTLMKHGGGIPSSAKEAVQRARANGHLVFLCTGRSRHEIKTVLDEVDVDGIVAAAGGYIEIEGEILRQELIAIEDVKFIVDYLESKDIPYCLESHVGSFVGVKTKEHFKKLMQTGLEEHPEESEELKKHFIPFVEGMIDNVDLLRDDIGKVTFFGSDVSFSETAKYFEDKFVVLPNSVSIAGENSGEIMIPNVHKASGIEFILRHLGLHKEDAFAYGDSYNDLEMIQYVGCGVAMGNACEALKEVADDITDSVDQDGIYKSFEKYHLMN